MFPYPPVRVWVLLCLMIVGATANLLAIDRLVPQEYATIQEAIVAAQTGDVVLVSPGTYSELIDFLGKTIAVRSTDGPAVTIIDGGGSGPIVTFQNLEGPGSVLEGFTITNGVAAEGAGITILDAYPTILNNTISSNTATAGSGGGILMRNYTPNIDVSLIPQIAGNIISANVALTSAGGGLYAYSGHDFPQLSGNTWNENLASMGSTIFVTSNSSANTGVRFQSENITSGYDPSSTTPTNADTIDINNVNLEIRDSEVQIHNSTSWGGIRTNNQETTIENSTLRSFGDSDNNNSGTANFQSNHLILSNLTLINDSTSSFSTFNTEAPYITSKGLRSLGVTPDFYSGYYTPNSKFTVTDTALTDTGMHLEQYAIYQSSEMIIDELLITGTLTGSREPLDILVGGYYYGSDYKVKASNIVINDMEIVDNPGQIINVNTWSASSLRIDLENINISGLQINETNPVNVIGFNMESYDSADELKVSLHNILVENPTINSTPIYLYHYSQLVVETAFKAKNLTVTGASAASGAIVMGEGSGIPLVLEVSHSIVEGPVPFASDFQDQTTATFSNSLTSIPVAGENNLVGEVNFASGDLGDYYLAQIASGDLTDSLGVDAGDPNTTAPFLGGTRTDGGLDTGVPDLGYHYPARTESSAVSLLLDDAAVFYEPGTGLIDSPFVSVYLSEALSPGESPSEWRGLSLRLLQESGPLQISSVQLSDELLASLGNPPEYFEALVCGDVVTVGMIPSLSDPSITFSLSSETEILQFEMTAGPELASSTEVIETQWIPQDGPGCGGILDVNNLLTDSLGNTTPLNRQPIRITLVPRPFFLRGDANADGQSDLGDAVALLSLLFNGFDSLKCDDASDINDDGLIDIADPINLLAALFTSGSPPPAPGQSCGVDPTPDTLRCESYEVCTPTVSLTSFSVTPTEPGVVQLSWETAGPVDQFQISNNGIVHQRLAGTATGSEIRSLPPGLQDVCLWVLAEGQIIEQCLSVFTSEPVVDLTCQMDTLSPDAILEWVPQPGIDQLEIYSGTDLLAVVDADDLLAQISVPPTGLQNFCLIGVTGQIVSAPLCCKVQGNDECYGAVPLTLGDHSIPFEASTTSQDAYDSGQCLSCWNSSPETFFTANGGDVWYSYEAEQSGVLLFDYSADMVIYEGDCSALTQKYCGFGVMRQVEAGDQFLIRLGGWIGSNINFNLAYIDTLPPPFIYHCSQGFDSNSGLYRVSWGVGGPNNYYELMTVTVDGVEVGTVPGTDGTFLIPGLISGNTYEICITGQTGSLISPAACQTVTIP